jgi:hypothetical protein
MGLLIPKLFALVARRRKRLFVTELLAGALALGLSLLAGEAAGTDWPSSLKGIGSSHAPPVYLAIRLAIATAIVVMASPHMSSPIRFIGRWIVTVGAIAGVALGVTLPIGMVAGLLIGLGSGAILHLVLGSRRGVSTLDQIAGAGRLGVEAIDLRRARWNRLASPWSEPSLPTGKQLLVKVYGGMRGTAVPSPRSGVPCGTVANDPASGSAASVRWSTRRS